MKQLRILIVEDGATVAVHLQRAGRAGKSSECRPLEKNAVRLANLARTRPDVERLLKLELSE